MSTFPTIDEAITRLVVEPIEATGVVTDARAEYDIDAIADELLVFDDAFDAETGTYHLNAQGYRVADAFRDPEGGDPAFSESEMFWALVRAHERG